MTSPPQVTEPTRYAFEPSTWAPPVDVGPLWPLATRIAFRFCCVYFGLYVLTTQMITSLLPLVSFPIALLLRPLASLYAWIGTHILGISRAIPIGPSGSGDRTVNWIHALILLVVATIATTVWSWVARDKRHHERLFAWFRLFIRFAVGTTFLGYGMSKVIPMQMPILDLTRLVEPFGNFSPMGVLWYSVGASPAYEIFIGLAETTAALLLFVPRTAQLGAMMALMDAVGVFAMNMMYDVPVKLFALHLVLMSLCLLAPNARRLYDLFILHRTASIPDEPPVGATEKARRRWGVAQIAFGGLVLGLAVLQSAIVWRQYGGGAPKSALFGIWSVDQMSIDGQVRPPLLTDQGRWKRIIFQQPTMAVFQGMNDGFSRYVAAIDTTAHTLTLSATASSPTKFPLKFSRPTKERLVIDGTLDGDVVHMELSFRDPDSYLIRSRGFNWIQEFPFNR